MRAAQTVFFKEMREILRDRRSLLVSFLLPLLVVPLVLLLMAPAVASRERSDREEVLTVALVNTAAIPNLPEAIGARRDLQTRSFAVREDAEAALQQQAVRAVLLVPPEAVEAFAAGRPAAAELVFDGATDKSRLARDRLEAVLREVEQREQLRRLEARGLDRSLLEPLAITRTNQATPQRKAGFVLGSILPYFVILWTAVGGMHAAFDLCAGEKERGTMETLLVSSASRRQIIVGKIAAVGCLSIASTVFSLTGLVVSLSGAFNFLTPVTEEAISISYTSVAAALLTAVPLALMMSSVALAVSAFARNQKEAQTYVFPITMSVIVAGMLSTILGQENALALSLVPVLNTALAMKQVLSGVFNLPFLGLALASSVGYALLALKLVLAMFERESVLFRA